MKARVHVLTLGVSDLPAALAFYRDGLGLPSEGIVGTEFEDGAVAFIPLHGGLTLALFPFQSLAKDAAVAVGPPSHAAISIGHIVDSREEVDRLMAKAQIGGAKVTESARDRFWGGYSGYFQDLDGHLWEIAWNPHWESGD